MLDQQETFKLGEWAPEETEYFCAACDRHGAGPALTLEKGQVFPFCPRCKDAAQPEVDQLWVRVRDRELWRHQLATRWRELWRS